MVYTALMLPWILGGFVSESQHLKVTCFDRFQVLVSFPLPYRPPPLARLPPSYP